MRALLLGPNGQLGHDLRRAHAAAGEPFELVCVGRDRLDVARPDALERTLDEAQFDWLINCTSYHKTDEVEANAGYAFAVNAFAVRTMAGVCRRMDARLLHISTDYVFGGLGRTTPFTESDGIGPMNVYGASKAMGEQLALLADPRTTILRVASLFGVAGASGKGGNFVETMIRLARERGELRVVDDVTMSPTWTMDVARAALALVLHGAEPGIYHAVNTGAATWCGFAREIVAQAGLDAAVVPITSAEFPTTAVRPPYTALDNAKLSRVAGPLPAWQEALDGYLRDKGHVAARATAAAQ